MKIKRSNNATYYGYAITTVLNAILKFLVCNKKNKERRMYYYEIIIMLKYLILKSLNKIDSFVYKTKSHPKI